MNGWFRFWRCMRDHPVWDLPPGQFKVWMTLLAMANLKPAAWYDGKERVQIAPGALVTSQEHLAKEARVSRKVARLALASLERIGSIRTKVRANRWTLVEVVNWPTYQGAAPEKGQPGANPNRAEGPTGGPTDLRGGNGREGPTGGPTENPQEGHNLRSTERRKQLPTGARSIRRGGGAADGGTPRPPVAPTGPGSSQGSAAREKQEPRPLQDAAGLEQAEEGLTLRQLETIALVSMPPGPLRSPARAFCDGASPGVSESLPSEAEGDGRAPGARVPGTPVGDGGAGPP